MIGYKGFDKDLKCRKFQYEIGKTYEMEEEPIYEKGFHFCENLVDVFGYYEFTKNTRICKVEALGTIIQEGTKYVTNKIKILEEISIDEIEINPNNIGERNTGEHNSGDYNSGDCNTGYGNSGSYNSGSCNSGDYNTEDCNTGNYNSGYGNSGSCNSGSHNTGNYNSGYSNSGYGNSGSHNTGDFNSGSHNTGDFNSGCSNSGSHNAGNFNTCNYSSGDFCNKYPEFILFNKPCGITKEQFLCNLDYNYEKLIYNISFNHLNDMDWERIRALPNYDPQIFFECTGIKDLNYFKEDK